MKKNTLCFRLNLLTEIFELFLVFVIADCKEMGKPTHVNFDEFCTIVAELKSSANTNGSTTESETSFCSFFNPFVRCLGIYH